MSRTNLESGSKPNPDGVIERAIKFAHDEFERTLAEEWKAEADSATIRNAMAILQYRCRNCGKPVAGLWNICACRAKVHSEGVHSNPRDTLFGMIQQRCCDIATSRSLANFVKTIGNIALANDRDLKWVECQVQRLLPSLKGTGRKWAMRICPIPFTDIGVLPAWFRDLRTEIPERDLRRGLSPEDSEAELVGIEAEIERWFEKAKKIALDHVSLQMVQTVHRVPKPGPRRRARQDVIASIIARAKRENPGASVEQICKIVDSKRCPLRARDMVAGYSNWYGAWKALKYRPVVKRFISGIKPAAPQKKI